MSEPLFFRRTLCRADTAIGFEPQVAVYLRERESDTAFRLHEAASANLGIVDDMLVAEFYLDDRPELLQDKVAVVSLLGDREKGNEVEGVALRITGIVLSLNGLQ